MEQYTIYIITDNCAASYIEQCDLEGFKQYVEDDEFFYFETRTFNSKSEQSAFVEGFSHCCDERNISGRAILYEEETSDRPYINILKTI